LGEVDINLIKALERIIVGEDKPDLTIILDVPAEQGVERAAERRGEAAADRFEAEAIEYHTQLRTAFLTLAVREPDRCVVIDTTLPRPEVADRIWREVEARLIRPRVRAMPRAASA
jgi:dTMP kinase